MSEDFTKSDTLLRNASLNNAFQKLRDKRVGESVELTDFEAQHVLEHLKIAVRVKDEVLLKKKLETTLYDMRRDYSREGKVELAKDIEWQNMTVRVEREKLEKVVHGRVGGQWF